ncbi:UNVERIFIED_CONTAM: hypothetical protein K2H54_001413 [Gekko kuhli]
METITLFPESAKEDHVANFLQDQIYKHKRTLLTLAQLPHLECQRYVKTLRHQLQPILAVAVKIRQMLSNHAEKLSSNIEMSLCFTCLFLSRCERDVLFFPDRANKKAFDCEELTVMSEGRLRKQIRMDLIQVFTS